MNKNYWNETGILRENTWIICERDMNLLHDHSSNIHTSTARHMLDRATRVTGNFRIIDSLVIYDKLL